jgi:hypothetical protein
MTRLNAVWLSTCCAAITTADLTLTYNGTGAVPSNDTCANAQQGTDETGGSRVPDFPVSYVVADANAK